MLLESWLIGRCLRRARAGPPAPPARRSTASASMSATTHDTSASASRTQQACGILILSISSSLDNFLVGASLGISGDAAHLSVSLNAIISFCNALGALSSTYFGRVAGGRAPALAGCLAAGIFAWLSYGEADAAYRGGPSALSSDAAAGRAWVVAVPMTLNNLAGGVAGGLSGYPAPAMGAAAFAASFSLMALGFAVGKVGNNATAANPHAFAAAAFGLLAAAQVRDVLAARRRTRGDPTPDVGEDAYAAVPSEDAATYAPFSVGDASSHSE